MGDDFDRTILVCMSVEHAAAVVPGSVRGEYCMECATEVWMSPLGKTYWDEHPDTQILCEICGANQMEADDSIGREREMRALPGDRLGEALLRAHPDLVRRAYGRDQA